MHILQDSADHRIIKEKPEVTDMRLRKPQKRIVELSAAEIRLLRTAMMRFRNKVLSAGKPTEDIDELLLQLM